MQQRRRQSPSYGQRTGYDQAIVTLTDSVPGYRKDNRLGPYGSPESREPEPHHRAPAQPHPRGRPRRAAEGARAARGGRAACTTSTRKDSNATRVRWTRTGRSGGSPASYPSPPAKRIRNCVR